MVAALADPELYTFIGGEPPSEADLLARYTRQVAGTGWLNWVVRLRSTAEAIGTVQATIGAGASAEVAWVLSTRHQGSGYATEAATAALDWLCAQGVRSFTAHIHPDHVASQALARHLGFAETAERVEGEVRWILAR
jgi:RimJ/RimL family protein N-acetyltransferase